MMTLQKTLPDAQIICIVNCDLKDELTAGYLEICDHLGISAVKLEDIDKRGGHPTVKGMEQIKQQILDAVSSSANP